MYLFNSWLPSTRVEGGENNFVSLSIIYFFRALSLNLCAGRTRKAITCTSEESSAKIEHFKSCSLSCEIKRPACWRTNETGRGLAYMYVNMFVLTEKIFRSRRQTIFLCICLTSLCRGELEGKIGWEEVDVLFPGLLTLKKQLINELTN